MNLFYLPFVYSYQTRFLRPIKFASWFFIYPIPLLLLIGLTVTDFGFSSVAAFVLVVLNTYNLYEIGYIYNDTATIKNESKPTLRLNDAQLEYFENRRITIYIVRCALSIVLVAVLALFFSEDVNIERVVLISVVMSAIFYWYNSVRSLLNLPLHFLLVVCRFALVPLVFFTSVPQLELLLLTICLFPVPNLIERAGEKRFSLKLFQNEFFLNRAKFRNCYYFAGSVVLFAVTQDLSSAGILLFAYFFAYRFSSSIVVPQDKL